jgi:hypothetical protein
VRGLWQGLVVLLGRVLPELLEPAQVLLVPAVLPVWAWALAYPLVLEVSGLAPQVQLALVLVRARA